MHGDEEATMATLSARRGLVDDIIARHRGRIANTAGDSVLAEFASVLDAVHWAVEIQEALAGANAGEPDGRQMLFRIGVNVGDVMFKEGDIFGDGVNVAARLEGLVRGGEICVSRGVHITCVIAAWPSMIWANNWSKTSRTRSGRFGSASAEISPSKRPRPPGSWLGHLMRLPPRRPSPNSPLTMRSPSSSRFGTASRRAALPSSNPTSGNIRRAPSPRSPEHGLMPPRPRPQAERGRRPRKSPQRLSTLPSGTPSRKAIDVRSFGSIWNSIRTAISRGSLGRASLPQM